MNYPFLHQTLGKLNIEDIRKNLIYTNEEVPVWDDWKLLTIDSVLIRQYLSEKIPHLRLFRDKIFISAGTNSHFHLDRFHIHHLLHRILIPLDAHYYYEWIANDKTVKYQPQPGEVILFNNMVPHRFVSTNNMSREVVYLDLFDPLVENAFDSFKGNYSEENGRLEKKYG